MSALPPKADMAGGRLDVRFVPKADICSAAKSCLFDHLVGCLQEGFGDCEAERFGGLEIDYELILCRLLEWEIGSLFTAQNAVDIDS
jgi:hypothetical protein